METYKKMFAEIDVDGSGSITRDEFIAHYKKQNPLMAAEEYFITFIYDVIDDDKSGSITFDEFAIFAKAYTTIKTDTQRGIMECIFKVIDRNDSGYIEPEEVKKILLSLGYAPSAKDCEDLIPMLDLNGDGKIDFDEFCDMLS